jgi:(2Fe-2S) ferredoxin
MCSQRTRDARCGQSAPLLQREFERHLRPLGLYRDMHDQRPGGVGIYFISHVGGHKFSANIMVYRRADAVVKNTLKGEAEVNGNGLAKEKVVVGRMGEGAQCIWLARVRPEDCEGIVKYTVLQGKVVKPQSQLRGGFDREKGLVSW